MNSKSSVTCQEEWSQPDIVLQTASDEEHQGDNDSNIQRLACGETNSQVDSTCAVSFHSVPQSDGQWIPSWWSLVMEIMCLRAKRVRSPGAFWHTYLAIIDRKKQDSTWKFVANQKTMFQEDANHLKLGRIPTRNLRDTQDTNSSVRLRGWETKVGTWTRG